MNQPPNPTTSFNTASLYVGDLHPEVTETMLFELFKSIGPVASLRVCRDAMTRRSLGYAYVNFHNPVDAERALDTLNYTPIRGRACRIMWSHRDPSLRRSGQNNVFIKNLDKSVDNKALYDTFSAFGNILSCKVANDEHGQSKGYAFVHFETAEAAQQAIQKVNGMMLKDKIVFVGQFQSRRERSSTDPTQRSKFTNVFVKNLDPNTKTEQLKQLFERFGTVTSCVIMMNPDGTSKCFGFVNFESPEAARTAVDELNGQMVDSQVIYVGRAQKKAEREAELRAKFEQLKAERLAKEAGVNLYVKNLDDSVDDAKIKTEFAAYGNITSAKVMRDDKTKASKGFGFVCFSTPEEASKALTEMNGRLLAGKPLYVAMAQRKDVRRAQLESFHRAQANLARAGFPPNSVYAGMNPAVFYPPQGPVARGQGQYGVYAAQQMVPRGRWAGGARPYGGGYVPGAPVARRGRGGRGVRGMPMGQGMGPGMGPGMGQGVGQGVVPVGGHVPPVPVVAPPPDAQRGFKWTPDARNKDAAAPADAAPAADAHSQPSQEDRKLQLGEQLFPLIYAVQPKEAGKITGMLLESMSITELLELAENNILLNQRINEAMAVLQQAVSPAAAVTAPAAAVPVAATQ